MYEIDNELVLSIGEMIQYEDDDGEVLDGEVMEVCEALNMVQVLPVSSLLRIPEWVKAANILSDDDIEFVIE